MEYKIKNPQLQSINRQINELQQLLTDRISDLHQVKGMMQARHAYLFYREKLDEIKYLLDKNLEEIKPKK